MEWRVQSRWDGVHVRKDGTSGEPDVTRSYYGTTVDTGAIKKKKRLHDSTGSKITSMLFITFGNKNRYTFKDMNFQ